MPVVVNSLELIAPSDPPPATPETLDTLPKKDQTQRDTYWKMRYRASKYLRLRAR